MGQLVLTILMPEACSSAGCWHTRSQTCKQLRQTGQLVLHGHLLRNQVLVTVLMVTLCCHTAQRTPHIVSTLREACTQPPAPQLCPASLTSAAQHSPNPIATPCRCLALG